MRGISVIFRRLSANHYSIAKLLGLLDYCFGKNKISLIVWDNFDDISGFVSGNNIHVLAYSFMTHQLDVIEYEIKQLRSIIKKDDLIIAGGSHPTVDPQGTLSLGFDAVFIGESERAFVEFIDRIMNSGLSDIDPVWQDTNTEPLSIDDYPPFAANFNFFVPIELSRGCANACTFCNAPVIYGNRVRFRSVSGLRGPFSDLARENRKKVFFITSNMLSYTSKGYSSSKDSLIGLCELALSYGLTDIHLGSFPSEIRPEYLDEGYIKIFDKYCVNKMVVIGAQTGSERLLKLLKRGHTVDDVKNAAMLCKEYGFLPMIDFIFGFPQENHEDNIESVKLMDWLIKNAGAKIHPHYFMPLPKTLSWGEKPKEVDRHTSQFLKKMCKYGKSYGDFEAQKKLSDKIFLWKNEGKIHV